MTSMPSRSQASSNSGVGALCEVRMALSPMSLSRPTRKYCRRVRQGRADAGMVLMIARAFDGAGLAVEEKSLVWRRRRRCGCQILLSVRSATLPAEVTVVTN